MRISIFAGAVLVCWVPSSHATAQDRAAPKDRAALASCLEAASAEKRAPETCIGSVQGLCLKGSDGGTTIGMKECGAREIAAWDERLNAAYRAALSGDIGKREAIREGGRKLTGADVLRDAQRAWIVAREKKCDAAGLPMEGGTGAGLLSVDCFLQETARQALWLGGLHSP